MPYIGTKTSVRLTDDQKLRIKSGFGAILQEVVSKPEKVLLVDIIDEVDMYFGGEKGDFSFIEIRHLGRFDKKVKDAMTKKICDMYKEVAHIEKNHIYINFLEVERESWGYNGKTFG